MKMRQLIASAVLLGTLIASAPAAFAEEKPSQVLTGLSSTTISGYVDTSMEWQFGPPSSGASSGNQATAANRQAATQRVAGYGRWLSSILLWLRLYHSWG